MNPSESDVTAEEIATHLLAADEAFAAGHHLPEQWNDETSTVVRSQVEQALPCLQLLNQLRPRRLASRPYPTQPPPGARTTLAAENVPATLGRFQIRQLLGRGTFGLVYLAYDPQLQRDVALKVPRPERVLTPELRERFKRDAVAGAALNHPNLVPVYDAAVAGAVCFIASAYCPGPTLAEWLGARTKLMEPRAAAQLVATLARALHHAHLRHVVHRDLKPSNIILTPLAETESGRNPDCAPTVEWHQEAPAEMQNFVPRVLDFGLAKLLVQPGDPTLSRTILGTLQYMAPEQALGESKRVGPAADVHALGALLYEMLTGLPPFYADSDMETLRRVQSESPPPPHESNPAVDRELSAICLHCLEKKPALRPASAEALAEDLERWLRGQSRPWRQRVGRWARRHWLPGVACLFVAVGLGLVVRHQYESDPARQLGRLQQQMAAGESVDLIPNGEWQPWFRWVVPGEQEFQTRNREAVLSSLDQPTRLVIFPGAARETYRIHAEIFQEPLSDAQTFIGVTLFGHEWPTPQGQRIHCLARVVFNDSPHARQLNERAQCRTRWEIGWLNLETGLDHWVELGPAFFYDPPERQWHTLLIDVLPERLSLRWDQQSHDFSADDIHAAAQLLAQQSADTQVTQHFPDWNGAIGLYVFRGRARFRNVRIEPLPTLDGDPSHARTP